MVTAKRKNKKATAILQKAAAYMVAAFFCFHHPCTSCQHGHKCQQKKSHTLVALTYIPCSHYATSKKHLTFIGYRSPFTLYYHACVISMQQFLQVTYLFLQLIAYVGILNHNSAVRHLHKLHGRFNVLSVLHSLGYRRERLMLHKLESA